MKRIPLFSLRIRLLLLLLISLIPGVVLTFYALEDERHRANVQSQDLAYRLAGLISVHQGDLLRASKDFLFAVSQYPKIGGGVQGRFLANLLAHAPTYSDLGVADTNGNVIASAVPKVEHINIADRSYFRAALETGGFVVGEYQTSRTTGESSINFAYPIEDESGKKLGVLFAGLNLEELRNLESLVGRQLPEGWTLLVIDRNGNLLGRQPNGQNKTGRQATELSGILKGITQREGTFVGTDSTGRAHLYAYSEIRSSFFSSGLSVVLDIPKESAVSATNRIFSRSFVVLSVFGLVVLLAGGVANEFYLVRGLNAVRNAALQLAGGDLRARVGRVRALKEVRDLGKVFNDMSAMIESRETERERAVRSLRESEERYRLLFAYSPDAIYVHVEERVTLVNPAMCRLLGANEPSQLIGKSVFEIVHPDYREKIRERWKVIFGGQPAPLLEEKFIRLDGTVVDVEVSAVAIDCQGSKRVQVMVRDITERKRAEEALRQSECELAEAQRVARLGNWNLDLATNTLRWSEELGRIFDVENADQGVTYETYMSRIHPDDRPRVLQVNAEARSSGRPFEVEYSITTQSGQVKNVSVVGRSRTDRGGAVSSLFGTAQDITERKKAESALKVSMEQLHSLAERLERTREEERKAISHEVHDELGQVLTAIRLDLTTLKETGPVHKGDFEAKVKSLLNLTDKAIESVQDISSKLRPEMLDYLGLLPAIEWQTEEFEKHSGIQCSLELPDHEPSIDSDRATVLFRILQETLTNVARHANAKKVQVHFSELATEFTLAIIDDGIGISEEQIRNPRSLGLLGIRERLLPFRGTCTIQKGSQGGTEVLIRLPQKSVLDRGSQ